MQGRLFQLTKFFWENFGPLLVFQIVYRFAGYTVGTICAMVVTLGECLWLWRKREKPTGLFILSTSLCLVIGTLDLYFQSPTLAIYESPLINLFIAAVFALSLRNEVSLVQQVAERKTDLSGLETRDRQFFFRVFTAAWAFYYLVRAILFLWINLQNDIEQGFWIRLIVGKISFLVLLAASTLGGRPLWRLATKWRLLPSQKIRA